MLYTVVVMVLYICVITVYDLYMDVYMYAGGAIGQIVINTSDKKLLMIPVRMMWHYYRQQLFARPYVYVYMQCVHVNMCMNASHTYRNRLTYTPRIPCCKYLWYPFLSLMARFCNHSWPITGIHPISWVSTQMYTPQGMIGLPPQMKILLQNWRSRRRFRKHNSHSCADAKFCCI